MFKKIFIQLWSWLVGLFDLKPTAELTNEQKMKAKFEEGQCPDCGSTEFYEGPSGGLCINYECANCGSRFNVGMIGNSIIHFERI